MPTNKEFAENLLRLAEIAGQAKDLVQDNDLLKAVASLCDDLSNGCKRLNLEPKSVQPAKINGSILNFISSAFQSNEEKQRQRGVAYKASCDQFLETNEQPQHKPSAKFGIS